MNPERQTMTSVLIESGYYLDKASVLDMAEAFDLKCKLCGKPGMTCEGWRRPGGYRALAVCQCGYATEF